MKSSSIPKSPCKGSLLLRSALLANAAFSCFTGLLMALFPAALGAWMGLPKNLSLMPLGIGLLVFAGGLVHIATRQKPVAWHALIASLADFGWVLASLALLLFFSGSMSPNGELTVAAVACVVAIFGTLQVWGIDRMFRIPGSRLHRHCVPVMVDLPKEHMASQICNLGKIHKFSPTLISSNISKGKVGEGTVRTCTDNRGKKWSERCVSFHPVNGYEMEFLCDEPSFPFPARQMRGGWALETVDNGTIVRVWWELEIKPAFLAPLIICLLARQVDNTFVEVINRMAHGFGDRGSTSGNQAKLLPQFC